MTFLHGLRAFLRGMADPFCSRPLPPMAFPPLATDREALHMDFAAAGRDVLDTARRLAEESAAKDAGTLQVPGTAGERSPSP